MSTPHTHTHLKQNPYPTLPLPRNAAFDTQPKIPILLTVNSATAQSPAIKRGRGGYRPGAGRKPGTLVPHGDKAKANIKAGLIEKLLLDHASGKRALDNSQVTALRAVYDKYKPTLAAVEHTEPDPRDIGSPAEFFGKVVAILAANPALHERLNREVIAAREQQVAGTELGQALGGALCQTQSSDVQLLQHNESSSASAAQSMLEPTPTPGQAPPSPRTQLP